MKNKIGIFLMIIGTVLIGSALFLLLHNQKEDRSAGQASQSVMEKMQEELVEKGKEHSYEMIDGMPVIKIDGQDYIGVLEIPALNLRLPVMAEWSYPKS